MVANSRLAAPRICMAKITSTGGILQLFCLLLFNDLVILELKMKWKKYCATNSSQVSLCYIQSVFCFNASRLFVNHANTFTCCSMPELLLHRNHRACAAKLPDVPSRAKLLGSSSSQDRSLKQLIYPSGTKFPKNTSETGYSISSRAPI